MDNNFGATFKIKGKEHLFYLTGGCDFDSKGNYIEGSDYLNISCCVDNRLIKSTTIDGVKKEWFDFTNEEKITNENFIYNKEDAIKFLNNE